MYISRHIFLSSHFQIMTFQSIFNSIFVKTQKSHSMWFYKITKIFHRSRLLNSNTYYTYKHHVKSIAWLFSSTSHTLLLSKILMLSHIPNTFNFMFFYLYFHIISCIQHSTNLVAISLRLLDILKYRLHISYFHFQHDTTPSIHALHADSDFSFPNYDTQYGIYSDLIYFIATLISYILITLLYSY